MTPAFLCVYGRYDVSIFLENRALQYQVDVLLAIKTRELQLNVHLLIRGAQSGQLKQKNKRQPTGTVGHFGARFHSMANVTGMFHVVPRFGFVPKEGHSGSQDK